MGSEDKNRPKERVKIMDNSTLRNFHSKKFSAKTESGQTKDIQKTEQNE